MWESNSQISIPSIFRRKLKTLRLLQKQRLDVRKMFILLYSVDKIEWQLLFISRRETEKRKGFRLRKEYWNLIPVIFFSLLLKTFFVRWNFLFSTLIIKMTWQQSFTFSWSKLSSYCMRHLLTKCVLEKTSRIHKFEFILLILNTSLVVSVCWFPTILSRLHYFNGRERNTDLTQLSIYSLSWYMTNQLRSVIDCGK